MPLINVFMAGLWMHHELKGNLCYLCNQSVWEVWFKHFIISLMYHNLHDRLLNYGKNGIALLLEIWPSPQQNYPKSSVPSHFKLVVHQHLVIINKTTLKEYISIAKRNKHNVQNHTVKHILAKRWWKWQIKQNSPLIIKIEL